MPDAVAVSGPRRTRTTPSRRGWFAYAFVVLGLFVAQQAFSRAGTLVSQAVPTDGVDPGAWFLPMTIHHVVQGLLTLAAIAVGARAFRLDFGLRVGDLRAGVRAVVVVLTVLVVYLAAYHALARGIGATPTPPAWPSDPGSRWGLLGFQLLLTGPSEELLFRALPITVLAAVRSTVLVRRWDIRLEAVVAAVLFSLGHVVWTISPTAVTADPNQLAFTAVLGLVQGVVYQRTRSVLYPMAIHSLANLLVPAAALIAV